MSEAACNHRARIARATQSVSTPELLRQARIVRASMQQNIREIRDCCRVLNDQRLEMQTGQKKRFVPV